jgi:hypothetical protein
VANEPTAPLSHSGELGTCGSAAPCLIASRENLTVHPLVATPRALSLGDCGCREGRPPSNVKAPP